MRRSYSSGLVELPFETSLRIEKQSMRVPITDATR